MAEFNENKDGVFGGVQFNENNNGTENTSYFEGTIGNESTEGALNSEENNSNDSVFGSFQEPISKADNGSVNGTFGYDTVQKDKAITKQSLWSKIRAFLFQEIDLNAPIKVELTPYQQKVENEINDFLHQEVSFKGIVNMFKGNK